MSENARRDELTRRHAELDRRLQVAKASPSTDELTLKALKADKLRIKDKIAGMGRRH